MKKFSLLILLLVLLGRTQAQTSTNRLYLTYGPEMVMSFGMIDDNDLNTGTLMRFTPFINIIVLANKDFGKHFGLTFGASVHNTGFILNYEDTLLRYKFRTYNIGLPMGFKVGNLNRFYFYGGYELEFPISYKEKKYIYDGESMFMEWFTGRVKKVNHAVYAGIGLKHGIGIKVKYYLNEFFNRDYVDADGVVPYKNIKAHVLYLSIDFLLFRNNKFAVGN